MELDWSSQSPHIRSFYPPWQPGDGYPEDVIAAAEAHCSVHLPAGLRSFYRTWGRRRDLTRLQEHLLGPDELVVRSGALIFCVENQGITYWAVRLESLGQADPPIVIAEAGPERSYRDVASELKWHQSHQHLSGLLDDLTYLHAFAGGALHGARSANLLPTPSQVAWLEREWGKATLSQMFVSHDIEPIEWRLSPVYVRDGQALWWFTGCSVISSNKEALDEIAQALGIPWAEQW